jgi:type I restriction enzyme S subunit
MKKTWEHKKLGEVLTLEYGKPLLPDQRKSDGKYPVYGANGIKDRTDGYFYDKPSIIIGRKGSAGEINLTEEKFWPLDVTYYVVYDQKKYDRKFLFYLLRNLQLQKLAKGVKPGINRNDVYAIKVDIPPLPEQQRIVDILDQSFAAIDQAIENTKKNIIHLFDLTKSYLTSILENKQDGNWIQKKIKSITTKIGSGATPLGGKNSYQKKGISLIRSLNVYDDGFQYKNLAFIDEKQAQKLSSVEIEKRDILLNITGASILRCCVVPEDVLPARVNQHVLILRPVENIILPEFLHLLIISADYKSSLLQIAKAGGSTREALTKEGVSIE